MVIIVTVVKSFMQGLRMIINEFAVLDSDSEDDSDGNDDAEVKEKAISSIYVKVFSSTNRIVTKQQQ